MITDKNIRVRFLSEKERGLKTEEKHTPLVVEPVNPDQAASSFNHLTAYSADILSSISKYGAVLLRNFGVSSEVEFERLISCIHGIHGMNNYFMAEPGRTKIAGSRFVFHTNELYKTGGTLRFRGFHSENYYSTDVPRYISFCCLKPSAQGGETGLVNMAKVYNDLNDELKKKLESKPFFTSSYQVSQIAERYSISKEQVKEICAKFGLSVYLNADNEEVIAFYKPSVLDHPTTGQAALILNVSAEIPGLHSELIKQFSRDYSGWKWSIHRLCWHHPKLLALGQANFKTILKTAYSKFLSKPEKSIQQPAKQTSPFSRQRVGSVFTKKDIEDLAGSMRNHFTSFTWQQGDILIVDNLQMAHAGMPGRGARLLRTMICNPVQMEHSFDSSGHQTLRENTAAKPLVEVLETQMSNQPA